MLIRGTGCIEYSMRGLIVWGWQVDVSITFMSCSCAVAVTESFVACGSTAIACKLKYTTISLLSGHCKHATNNRCAHKESVG
jgi:hypothetical protein